MSIYLRFTPLRFYWVGICILRLQAEPTPLDGATKPFGPGDQGPRKKSVTAQDRLFIRSEYVLMTDDATLFREGCITYLYIHLYTASCPLSLDMDLSSRICASSSSAAARCSPGKRIARSIATGKPRCRPRIMTAHKISLLTICQPPLKL